MSDAIVVKGLAREYGTGSSAVTALGGVDLSIREGEFVAVSGPSGSGKSTLLHLLGGLDTPTGGTVEVMGKRLDRMGPDELARFRLENVGFVFQFFNLIPSLTAGQNVAVSRMFAGGDPLPRAMELLEEVGLGERAGHLPSELSGGEMQRVAIARALMNDPAIILADEPTGNLDSTTGKEVLALFRKLNRKGKTAVLVTHDPGVAKMAHRFVELRDGLLAGSARGKKRRDAKRGERSS
jgi:putative ABC transport system ATP-binding protein